MNDLTSGDETRAEKAVRLVELGEEAVPALLDLTNSSGCGPALVGTAHLAQSPSDAEAEWLVPFLNDPAPEVRQCAALGLADKPDESASGHWSGR